MACGIQWVTDIEVCYTNLVRSCFYFKCKSNYNSSNYHEIILEIFMLQWISVCFRYGFWGFQYSLYSVPGKLRLIINNLKDSPHLFLIFVGVSLSFMTCYRLIKLRIYDALRDLVLFLHLKNVKSTYGEVLPLVKLKDLVCNFTRTITSPWVFFVSFNL